jgi:hypothetical protein
VACARPENNNRAKDAKSSERAPLIVTPIRKPTADWDEGKLLWWLKFRLPNLTVGSTPAAEVRPSKTAGHGLFTTIEISAGALVSRVGGRLVGSAELDALLAQPEYVNTISVATWFSHPDALTGTAIIPAIRTCGGTAPTISSRGGLFEPAKNLRTNTRPAPRSTASR